ncbi:hypothetical protein ABZW18_34335 [Streptomyces sp. NPDC004647]|uniref:hypothetical protein n=1 Tax=Streptomyces sp. NPDC004647 TaxID=3154671 RepID=UPI0033A79680
MFVGTADDPRVGAPSTGEERGMLIGFLTAQRATLKLKCAALEAELSRQSVEPSALSLLGLGRGAGH